MELELEVELELELDPAADRYAGAWFFLFLKKPFSLGWYYQVRLKSPL
jgi:hypothetical protein